MIKLNKVKEPRFFKSNKCNELRNNIKRHFSQPKDFRSQEKFPIPNLSEKLYEIKEALFLKSNNKCAYCESKIINDNIGLDHFRPHYAAANLDGKIAPEHYWWLALRWNNLFPSCFMCNSNKKNYFPILNKRADIQYYSKKRLFDIEKPLLIDPDIENPEEHFYYDKEGRIFSNTERGQVTIRVLSLNRPKLLNNRRKVVVEMIELFNKIEEVYDNSIREEEARYKIEELFFNAFESTELPYLGIRRYFVRNFLNEKVLSFDNILDVKFKKNLKLKIKTEPQFEDETLNDRIKLEIESVKINNYKSIDELTLNFNRTDKGKAGWVILIGENGVGKSSTLSATLKALIQGNHREYRFNASEVKRNQEGNSEIQISFQNNDEVISAEIGKRAKYKSPFNFFVKIPIIAFGPFKHSNKNNIRYKGFVEERFVDNFFKSDRPLRDPLSFLLLLTPEQFEYVAIALLDLLMLQGKARIHRNITTNRIWFQYKESDNKHYLDELSDGYKSVITLGCNIIEGLLLNNESIENASGFVVIDEIGANLHPRWKMQIVKLLRKTFPNVQFLVTTHDPLCLKGIEANETYVLKSNSGKLEVLKDLPNPSEYRADQLLTSEFFGLFSTVEPEMEEAFKEYYKLLYKSEELLTEEEKKRLVELKGELREKNHLGDSLRDELLYVAIDTILAKEKMSREKFSRLKVKEKVKNKAISILDEFLEDF